MLDIAPRVAAALADKRPIVALESTLISHGLPSPHNLECALAAEQEVRKAGAEPATIGIISGRLIVGLDQRQLALLADPTTTPRKVSTRDIAVTVAQRGHGATTVAASLWIAANAGISVFATGGIGGVHRGLTRTLDISADLKALASVTIAVVCSGAKVILDLPKTVEALEALGIPLLGLGCNEFPGFYVTHTGLALDAVVDNEEDAAAIVLTQKQLRLDCGLLVLNPVPPQFAIDAAEADQWITQALAAAASDQIDGKAVTPFLLQRVAQLSQGRTLAANVALIQNNAAAAARLAIALARLEHDRARPAVPR